MNAKARFQKSLDSQFKHLGHKAIYVSTAGDRQPIRVIPRRPEQLFELGESQLHAENPQLEFRVSEVQSPARGDEIELDSKTYRIEAEPRLDLHQLVWLVECLDVHRT